MRTNYASLLRVAFGVLGLSSVVIEILVLRSEGVFNPANFFSFFTIISNVFAGAYLIYFGLSNDRSRRSHVIRGAATLYMLMTGVIFAVLLAGLENVRLTAVPWDNVVLHYIMPIVMVVDWLVAPPKNSFTTKAMLVWVAFPFLYVAYTLFRGSIVGWYPYPFLNPLLSSYAQVLITSLVIAIFVIAAAYTLKATPRLRKKHKRV